jgi:adenylate cyclase
VSDDATLRTIRHELRTPLNHILGYSELLGEELSETGPRHLLPDLEKIGMAARRLISLVDRFFADGAHAPETRTLTAAGWAAARNDARPVPSQSRPSCEAAVRVAPAPPIEAGGALLVVDDDKLNRDLLARRLARRGYQVEVASGGHEALEMAQSGRFALVLLDVMMPDIDGLEVLRRLRESFSPSDLPVVMATAMDSSEDVVAALHGGANDYVTKPLDFDVVLARVESQLGLKRAKERVVQLVHELERRNRFIRKTFGQFLSDEVVEALLDSPEGVRLGGERRRVTILMSDLRGFTALASRVSPEQLVSLLNVYLGKMAEVIMSYGGTVDELLGDAVLAVFGAPAFRPNDAARAVACAVAMQHAVLAVNAENRQRGLPEISMGIALNTADVVVGNIGSAQRMKYAVVGAAVNLTARIESYALGGQVLVSASVLQEAGSIVSVGSKTVVRGKGLAEPITAYELRGIAGGYDLYLSEQVEPLVVLLQAIPVELWLVQDKKIAHERYRARFVKLSNQGGELQVSRPLPVQSNLLLRVFEPAGARLAGDLYAKVVASTAEQSVLVRFTAVPCELEASLERWMASGG